MVHRSATHDYYAVRGTLMLMHTHFPSTLPLALANTVARFMLEFVYAAHELFERTRSFVFVSELGETTDLFGRSNVSVALGQGQ